MRLQFRHLLVGIALPTFCVALPSTGPQAREEIAAHLRHNRSFEERNGVNHTIFEHGASGSKIDFVTNSGLCETTPGVNQYSGYLSSGHNQHMFFWFFEARNNPTSAPLAIWLNGGPGCSSMIGLFQENGPCHFGINDTEPSLNPHSWNEYANMIYVDQPIGTGFSYGDDPVSGTVDAAKWVWKLLQTFFAQFPEYESRDFGLFTESYGGHYGPEFAHYIQTQNTGIFNGTVKGEAINLIALGINNGWYDSTIQEKAYVEFSYNNTWRPIIDNNTYKDLINDYNTYVQPAIAKCTDVTKHNRECVNADSMSGNYIETPLYGAADFDPYDIRVSRSDPYPPENYATYLANPTIMAKIGANSTYSECSSAGDKFGSTGDSSRSFLPALSSVVQSGISVLIWAGDADWICNWFGGFASANAIEYPLAAEFQAKDVSPYTVNGVQAGTFKNAGNLSWLRVFAAGHEVPYYQPELALQVFKQTMMKQAISPT